MINFQNVFEKIDKKNKVKIACICPHDKENLEVIQESEKTDLASFVLIGNEEKIRSLIEENSLEIESEIIDKKDDKDAADYAVDLVDQGKADTVMKGLLHSSTFLKAVLNKEKSLNSGNLISQITIVEKNDGQLLFLTDCAIAIKPDLKDKVSIVKNAVKFAQQIGIDEPKVAVLAAVEVVNLAMEDTIDAAILSKMADRKQIKHCLIDGPLAFDNAVSLEAAEQKGIDSEVAGCADIILVPSLTVGNAVSKALQHIGGMKMAAATVGTNTPIVFNSRTETIENKMLSIALTVLSIQNMRK